MKRNLFVLFVLALVSSVPAAETTTTETNTPPAAVADAAAAPASTTGYDTFKLINERNIFNQNRTATSYAERNRPPERQPQIETFVLVGTIRYAKGDFAFFDGSSSEFRKTLKPSDSIAGYTIAQIGQSSVKLASTNNEVELPVGMQMRRQDAGEWQLTERTESDTRSFARSESSSASREGFRSRETSREGNRDFTRTRESGRDFNRRDRGGSNTTTSISPATSAPREPATGASEDEILRRLMERRQRE